MHSISNATPFVACGVTSSPPGPAQPASPDAVMVTVYSSFSTLSLQDPVRPSQEPALTRTQGLRGLGIHIPPANPATRAVQSFGDRGITRASGPVVRERSPRSASPQAPGTGGAALGDWPTLADIGRRYRADDDRSDRSRSPSPETKGSRSSGPWTDDEPSSPPLIVRESDILQLQDGLSPNRER